MKETFSPKVENTGKPCSSWERNEVICVYPKAEIQAMIYSECEGIIDPKTCLFMNRALLRARTRGETGPIRHLRVLNNPNPEPIN